MDTDHNKNEGFGTWPRMIAACTSAAAAGAILAHWFSPVFG